jgi:hypothetical protein
MKSDLKIISDTGDENSFQITPLFNEQFAEIGKVIQEHYDYFSNRISVNFQELFKQINDEKEDTNKKLENYNLKIIDLIFNVEKEIDKTMNNCHRVVDDKLEIIDTNFNSKIDILLNDLKDLKLSVESQTEKNKVISDNFSSIIDIQSNKLKDQEYFMELLRDDIKDRRNEIDILSEKILFMTNSINILKELKQDIKLPWYKRFFK